MKIPKTLLYIGLALQIFYIYCFLPTILYACWGARPLAMGGAFTGVADNVDAVYWNPAGLTQIQAFNLSSTYVTNWHYSNYDIYIAGAGPTKLGGLGFAYVYNKDHLAELVFESSGERFGWICQDWSYFHLSYGTYLIKSWNLSIGVIGKLISSEFEIDVKHEAKYGGDQTLADDIAYDLDLGVYEAFGPNVGKFKMFSIGCLIQDICKSKLNFKFEDGEEIIMEADINIRPGLSFRPDEKSIITLEIYDAATEFFDEAQIRVGAERWLSFGKGRKILSLRAGGYHINEKEMRAYTAGLSWRFKKGTELGYTIIYWDEYNERTHFISLDSGF